MSFLKNFLDGGAGEAKAANKANASMLSGLAKKQFGVGEGYLLQMLEAYDTAYANSKANIATQGNSAMNAIVAAGKKQQAINKQGLIDSGLSSTTKGANLANQTATQTQGAIGQLGEDLGAMYANLDTNYGNQKAGGFKSLADFAIDQIGITSNITPQHSAEGGGFLGGFGDAVGQGLGAWATGGLSAIKPKATGGN